MIIDNILLIDRCMKTKYLQIDNFLWLEKIEIVIVIQTWPECQTTLTFLAKYSKFDLIGTIYENV